MSCRAASFSWQCCRCSMVKPLTNMKLLDTSLGPCFVANRATVLSSSQPPDQMTPMTPSCVVQDHSWPHCCWPPEWCLSYIQRTATFYIQDHKITAFLACEETSSLRVMIYGGAGLGGCIKLWLIAIRLQFCRRTSQVQTGTRAQE